MIKIEQIISIWLVIMFIIMVGYIILVEEEQAWEEYSLNCNKTYGEGNWEIRPNGTKGLAVRYSCFSKGEM